MIMMINYPIMKTAILLMDFCNAFFFIFMIFKERRSRSKLPRALRGLMGEANIRYARGEKDDAVLMCMEIIRQGVLG